jgi:sortase A
MARWELRNGRAVGAVTALLAASITWHWGQAAAIHGKALLAQHLIATRWEHALASPAEGTESLKPWPSADTWPVARLQWVDSDHTDGIKQDLYVLAGANGSALAFGPGHLSGTALPGEGAVAIAGHRDTHFRFLEDVAVNDVFRLQNPQGRWVYFRASAIRIVNADEQDLTLNRDSHLYLITCYPFDAVSAGGPLRYVVEAEQFSF